MNIGIIIPVTSRLRDYKTPKDTDFFQIVFSSFLNTYKKNSEYIYNFHLGYDDDDKFYLEQEQAFKEYFKDLAPECFTLHLHKIENLKNKVGQIWSRLANFAAKESEYLYQIGDDIKFITPGWEDYFIRKLRKTDNIGVTGPLDLINTKILTQSFVHRTHLEIFGSYFPEEIENWFIDDWITLVYGHKYSNLDDTIKVVNSGGKARYFLNNDRTEINNILPKTKKILSDYMTRKDKFITEDDVAQWVYLNNGFVLTRKYDTSKLKNKNFKYACLTGYKNIIGFFLKKILPMVEEPITLILIESDVIEVSRHILEHKMVKKIFQWNKCQDHPKISCFPIGLNKDRNLESLLSSEKLEKTNMLMIDFSIDSHPSRKGIAENENLVKMAERIPKILYKKSYRKKSYTDGSILINETSEDYYKTMSSYKFVLSPRGAGEDCHRTWEAIYLGCIPIVLSSSIDEIYEDLPVLVVDSWGEINKELLEKTWEEYSKKDWKLEKSYLNYWLKKFENLPKPSENIRFITYGNDKFKIAKVRILDQAKSFGEFTSWKAYGPEDLDTEFKEKFKDVLSQPRIGGYGIWRPYIIKKELEKIKNDDFLMYCDAGCHLNPKGKKRFYEYLEILKKSDYGIMSFQMHDQIEKWWTTKEIFNYFNVEINSEISNSGQYLDGILIMKKNEHLMKTIDLWMKTVYDKPEIFTDKFNRLNQHSFFKDNRHEQSVFSIIRKIQGSEVIPKDETWHPQPFGSEESLKYPIWAKRDRN